MTPGLTIRVGDKPADSPSVLSKEGGKSNPYDKEEIERDGHIVPCV